MTNCLFAAFSAYIMVAFVNMEANPGLWQEFSRIMMIIVAMFLRSVLNDDSAS